MKKRKAGMNYALAFQLTDEKVKSGNELRSCIPANYRKNEKRE